MARTSKQRSTTTTTSSGTPDVVVVDGSNIATEGRSAPSLSQLDEAVSAFMAESPDSAVTVVVDATFGHRIDKREVKAYDEAVANNELVTPPAGAIGRGDAFVLSIADKVGARVLSNDSFQEFHGDYPWLFDEGRLVGGKPVPHIGWVFVDRVPVKGPKSRQSRSSTSTRSNAKKRAAAEPRASRRTGTTAPVKDAATAPASRSRSAPAASKAPPEPVNDTLPFLEFVERHPIGTSVNVEVESYASHGAYVKVGDIRAYVPLALMDDPAPTSARKVMSIGEALTLVVASYSPARRSIDLAAPHMLPAAEPANDDELPVASEAAGPEVTEPEPTPARTAKKTTAKKASTKKATATKATARKASATKTGATKKTAAKKTTADKAASTAGPGSPEVEAEETTAKRPARKRTPTATDEAPAARKSTAKKTAAKKSTAKKSAATTSSAAKKTAAKKSTAKKTAGTPRASGAAAKRSTTAGTTSTSATGTSRRSRTTGKGEDE